MTCNDCGKNSKMGIISCVECGALIDTADGVSHFCSTCGWPIENIENHCQFCGHILKSTNQSIPRKKKNLIVENKKVLTTMSRFARVPNNLPRFYKYAAIFFIILIIGALYLRPANTSRSITNQQPPLSLKESLVEMQVIEIASKFRCACGSCGGTPLEKCSCETAATEKNDIRQAVRQNKPLDVIIKEIDDVYGGLEIVGKG
jgi:hypothetical protein